MKQITIILFLTIPFFLFSCDDDDTVKIQTNIPFAFSVDVDESSIVDPESNQPEYSFTATDTYYLNDNEDLKDYLNNLIYIEGKEYSLTFNGLEGEEIINTIELSTEEDMTMKFDNITSSYSGNPLPFGGYIILGNNLLINKQLTITISGTTNTAPMDFDLDLILQFEAKADKLE